MPYGKLRSSKLGRPVFTPEFKQEAVQMLRCWTVIRPVRIQ